MQINSSKSHLNIRKRQANVKSAKPAGLGIVAAYHSLPRWPKAAVGGPVSYAPASIGAMIGTQYGGLPGRLVGAAVGSVASYMFMTEVADAYPRQAKVSAALSGVFAAVNGGSGLSLSGVGISLAWGAGIRCVQEFAMGGR